MTTTDQPKRQFPSNPPPPPPSSPKPPIPSASSPSSSSPKPLPVTPPMRAAAAATGGVGTAVASSVTPPMTGSGGRGGPTIPRKMTGVSPLASPSSSSSSPSSVTSAGAGAPESKPKKSLTQLLQVVTDSEPQFISMKQFLDELTSLLTKQLNHAQAQSEEGLRVAHSVQEFSVNFFNGEGDSKTMELGHCTAIVGSMIRAAQGIFEPKLKTGITKCLSSFNQLNKSFQDHAELRATLSETKARMDDLNEKLLSVQKRGKVDLVKLSELQQERDSTTAKCRKAAEETVFAFDSLRQSFIWNCLEQFGEYVSTYQQYYHSGSEFVDALMPKVESWRSQAAAIRSEQSERASQASSEGKIVMANGMLQLFANTEQQFVEKLRSITQQFMGNVLKDGSLFTEMSKEDVASIFGGIPHVLEFHQGLLKRLVSSQSVTGTFDEPHLSALCQTYDRFLETYCDSQEALYQCRKKSKAFSSLLKGLEAEAKASLDSLLAIPMTRISEYTTFLDSYSQQPRLSPDESQYVLRVIELMKELNIAAEQVRSRSQVAVVAKSVTGWPEGDAPQPPERRFVMDTPCASQQGHGHLYVLSDLVLLTRKSIIGLGKKNQFLAAFAITTTTARESGDDGLELTDSSKQGLTLLVSFETPEMRNTIGAKVRSLRVEADQNKVFGVDLPVLLASKREKGREIPSVLEETVDALLAYSLDLEGLFRISASAKEMDEIRAKLDTGQPVAFASVNGHAVAGVLKLWIRSLPEPLLTYALYDEFSVATKGKKEDDALRSVQAAIAKLPRVNRACLHRLITFLSAVEQNSSKNKMNAKNLSIVFSPQLLRSRKTQSMMNFADMSNTNFECVLFMIEHCRSLFDDWVRKSSSAAAPSKRLAVTLKAPPVTGVDITSPDIDILDGDSEEPPATSEATLSLRDIIRQGPLSKNREKWSNAWDQRWVIVKKGWMYHFRSQKDTKGGVINLQGASIQECVSSVTPAKKPHCFVVKASAETGPQEFVFCAKSQEEVIAWISAITTCIP